MHDLNMNYPVQCVWFGGLMAVNLTPYPQVSFVLVPLTL